jgi:putative Ca2+/H+ antiporter (TMEM165/GDT1 family)
MHEMSGTAAAVFIGVYFLILFGVYIALAIANGYLAARLGRSVPAWVILSLIPIVNVFFYLYMGYTVLFFIIDRLKEVSARAP